MRKRVNSSKNKLQKKNLIAYEPMYWLEINNHLVIRKPGIIKKRIGDNVWQILWKSRWSEEEEEDSSFREWSYFTDRVMWNKRIV